ncbi:hypothetical protein BOS5A_200215 [Bosea sp. EC-HK365B]|nr:hypothetical protein BOSE21B_100214 [Bosea sp. 21B]CAD5285273.1 hypothetical protein BOSE7B_41316 [Bosea sp. 7B]VVT57675.1 hypothetical protein BOS5A_200215 [Bosea sp. EC-HK365B]VXB72790.1 hypothetical protein BOSE125_150024 [Bosea sp. 125]VXC92752.1 hypothetical protein BOSE127_80099 [Bosea sp. 127]
MIALQRLFLRSEGDDLVLQIVRTEEVGEVELGGRALIGAERRAVQFLAGFDLARADHDPLAVIIGHGGEQDAVRGLTPHRPGCRIEQDVDLAGLECGETGRSRQRYDHDLLGVAEHRRCDGAAKVDVEAAMAAARVGDGEAGRAHGRAAFQDAALSHSVQGAGLSQPSAECKAKRTQLQQSFHGPIPVLPAACIAPPGVFERGETVLRWLREKRSKSLGLLQVS